MQIVSEGYKAAMGQLPYEARLTVGGVDEIPGEAVQEIYFRGGANPSGDQVILGGAVSASVEITLQKSFVTCELENREVTVELGQMVDGDMEWLPMGCYTIENANVDDDLIILTAQDALHAKFDRDYEPLEGFDFTSEGGVDSILFLQALCDRRGVEVDVEDLASHPLKISPEGFTERQIIGFISAIYGGFANISRTGILRIVRYAATETTVTADNYYENGMEKSDGDFHIGWLKCYNEVSELTMFVGDFDATQGVYLESIWMNQTILNELWEIIGGTVFRPVKNLTFFGDPTIDPGDIIQLEDLSGQLVNVPVMSISHEYDGGLMTSITASGQAKTTDKESPSSKSVDRKIARSTGKLDQMELLKRLTKEWTDDGLYLTEEGKLAIKATAIVAGILDASLIQVINLIAEHLISSKDEFTLEIDGATISLRNAHGETFAISNSDDQTYLYFTQYDSDGNVVHRSQYGANRVYVGGTWADPVFAIQVDNSGNTLMGLSQGESGDLTQMKKLSWQPNGDGTFTLIGTEEST